MGFLPEPQLLTTCCNTLLPLIDEKEKECLDLLNISGSTSAVNSIRALQLQRIIMVVGMFSIFEASLKGEYGLENALKEVVEILTNLQELELAVNLENYWMANNVLKHGSGRSHKKLMKIQNKLDFRIKNDGDWFFGEGDISEGHSLILVDVKFISNCAEIINQTSAQIEQWSRGQC